MSREPNRRTFLQTAGIALAGVPTAAAARGDDQHRVIEQARRVRRRTGSVERFREYLRARGFGVAGVDRTYTVRKGDVSTQKLDEADLSISISLADACYGGGQYWADLYWDWADSDWDDGGEAPADIAGFHWDSQDWYVADDDYYTDGAVSYRKSGPEGVAFDFDDSAGDGGDNHSCTCMVRTKDDSIDPYARQVFADYIHTYSNVTISGVGISTSGLTVNLSDESEKWHTDTDQSGSRLVISQGDAKTC